MDRDQILEQERRILHNLSKMPMRMLSMRERENLAAMLLHDLCGKDCFGLHKAAYFVDNPDFHCLRGIAGFSADENYKGQTSIWNEPDEFSTHLATTPFNEKVRAVNHHSVKASEASIIDGLKAVAQNLNWNDFDVASWQMPHDNFGIVMYEKANPADQLTDKYLVDGLSLLSFCPLF